MNKEINEILTEGLLKGYAGGSIRSKIDRDGFVLDSSSYRDPTKGRYHDEWAASSNGGGQELVESTDGEKGTRVYAGGSLSADRLQKMGLAEKDVISKLLFFVNTLEGRTRLDEDAELSEGEWSYLYKVLDKVREIPVSVGKEEIRYRNQLVFIHFHILSPVI